jgi:hypothetical protein
VDRPEPTPQPRPVGTESARSSLYARRTALRIWTRGMNFPCSPSNPRVRPFPSQLRGASSKKRSRSILRNLYFLPITLPSISPRRKSPQCSRVHSQNTRSLAKRQQLFTYWGRLNFQSLLIRHLIRTFLPMPDRNRVARLAVALGNERSHSALFARLFRFMPVCGRRNRTGCQRDSTSIEKVGRNLGAKLGSVGAKIGCVRSVRAAESA